MPSLGVMISMPRGANYDSIIGETTNVGEYLKSWGFYDMAMSMNGLQTGGGGLPI